MDIKNKMHLLKIVEAEGKDKYSKSGKASDPVKDLLNHYNNEYLSKYRVKGATVLKKQKPLMKTILDTFGGNVALVKGVISYFVQNYEQLPFVRLERFPRPLLGALNTFANEILRLMDEQNKPEPEQDDGSMPGFDFS